MSMVLTYLPKRENEMKSKFSLENKPFWLGLLLICLPIGSLPAADVVGGFNSVTIDNTDPANVFISSLTYNATTYTPGQFFYGTTTRFYNTSAGGTAVWIEGDPVPGDIVEVPGTSNAKVNDVGSHADNNLWVAAGSTDISSIDGLPFQQTIFASPVDTIFVFERGGNDNGTISPILLDDTLGTPLTLTANGAPYLSTGFSVAGQNAFGYVYTADSPIKGIQISAPGHDALSILSLSAVPEPGALFVLALGGLLVPWRRKRIVSPI